MTLIQTLFKKSIQDENYKEIYDFHRLLKVKEYIERREKANIKIDNKKKNILRQPIDIDEKVLVLAERLKKKDPPGFLYESTTQSKPFFNNNHQIFVIRKRVPIDNSYYYWVSKEGEEKK